MNAQSIFASPLFIGFEHLFAEVSRQQKTSNYPPFDLKTIDAEKNITQLVVAVAGFDEQDISITHERQLLSIEGKRHAEASDESKHHIEFCHQGIAKRDFKLNFRLAEFIEVKDATVKNGLLTITMALEIPESAKAKKINISKN